jgi:hypothetical protein
MWDIVVLAFFIPFFDIVRLNSYFTYKNSYNIQNYAIINSEFTERKGKMAIISLVTQPAISQNSLIGYAILAVNINSNNSTFIDYFVPMVSETLRVSPKEYITVEDINADLFKSFGVRIPFHVIRTILNKLRKKRHIGYDAASRSYKPNRLVLEKSNFNEKQMQTLVNHQILVSELKDFLSGFSLEVTLDEAEKYFEEFLEETGYSPFYDGKVDFSESEVDRKKRIYLVARFIKKTEADFSPTFKYYESIVMGNMLATAMYYTEPDKVQQKFNRTEIYLDAPFVIFALGYAGKLREEPCQELLKMLKENHASIRCFQHSVDEIKDILHGCISKLENGISDNFGTIEYFLQKEYEKADILRLIYCLEKEITSRLRVKIVEKPNFDQPHYNIDEKEFSNFLKENMRYKFTNSLDRDVDSVHAIVRLRKGHKSNTVETSRALFITNNERLSNQTKKYFKSVYNGSFIPPLLTDYTLTTLLWIKNPNIYPNLPRKRIIADCMASMQPTERVMNKYMETIKKLKETGELTEGDYSLLRISQESRKILMDETQGDEDILTNAKIYEIVELTKQKMMEDKDTLIEMKDHQLEGKKREIERFQEEQERKIDKDREKEKRQYERVEKISHRIHMVIAFFLSFAFCAGQFLFLRLTELNVSIWFQGLMYSLFAFLFPSMSFWGVGFFNPLKKSKSKLADYLNNVFYNIK